MRKLEGSSMQYLKTMKEGKDRYAKKKVCKWYFICVTDCTALFHTERDAKQTDTAKGDTSR